MTIRTQRVTDTDVFAFPHPNQFAESFVVDGNTVYVPLNNTVDANSAGLYALDMSTKVFTPIFLFEPNEVVFVAKRTRKYFVCNVTTTNHILLYDHTDGTRKHYSVIGCPNDLCIDPDDDNVAYVVLNMEFTNKNGLLVRIYLDTGLTEILLGRHKYALNNTPMDSFSGITIVDGTIYLCTLLNVISLKKDAPDVPGSCLVPASAFCTHPMFDNISIYGNKLHCAIFSYSDTLGYWVLTNHRLARALYWVASLFGLLFVAQRTCIDRCMKPTKVHFLTYDRTTQTHEYVIIDRVLTECDKEVTQLTQLDDHHYLLVNYKANCLVRVGLA